MSFLIMEERNSSSPVLRLDLDNFDSAAADRSRYVLTSPRSLESCARLGIKPVQLLIKSLNELIAERREVPFGVMGVMHESYERERLKLLRMCREERERIIQAEGDRQPGSAKASGLEVLSNTDQTGPVAYADLCLRGKSFSRSSCSVSAKKEPDRSTVSSTFNLGDFRRTPAAEMKLQRITKNINKEMCVTVSERDCKIAALMLARHEEEQARLKLCQQEEQERQDMRRREEAQHAEAERMRRKKLRQRSKQWHKELEARRRLREAQEKDRAGKLEKEAMLQEARWRRLKEDVDAQRREKMEAAQRDAEGRKHHQEKLLRQKEEGEEKMREREMQVAAEREENAKKRKLLQEKKEHKRLQEENRKELLRHILLKQQAAQRMEEEEEHMRTTLERKFHLSGEKRARAAEARLKELQERAAQEEEQVQRVQLKAELQSIQQLTHKQILAHLSQRRMERAVLQASEQQRSRAQQVQKDNRRRQLLHQRLRESLQREEEAMCKLRENYVSMKEWKRERLQRQQKQIQEEARRQARASFHMRERVKQHTSSRTFDRMALEAQLTASISHIKL
ncbi:coiled-coil domain-containing protein 177 [Salarias fasciatus]|nr:coiled-coil domain-containing protein 177-like [Salarias fasciatus]